MGRLYTLLSEKNMPTYEYQCQKCGHRFDHYQSMTEFPLKRCPLCKDKVERLISGGGGVIFKGSGFYITDYTRSEDYKKKTKEEKSNSTSTSSSDSKPALTSSSSDKTKPVKSTKTEKSSPSKKS